MTKLIAIGNTSDVGRPALTDDQVRDKVLAYCARYHVSPGPEDLPPFPAGRRETRQHREWLTVYRALHRAKARAAAGVASEAGGCPVCARVVGDEDAVAWPGRRARSWRLHPACAELVRLAEDAGPEALARLSALLWPRRGRGGGP